MALDPNEIGIVDPVTGPENVRPDSPVTEWTGRRILEAVSPVGATIGATSQVTTSGIAGTLAIARSTRRKLTIKNTDPSITVYVGPATVTAANGMPIKAGESISVSSVQLWQVIAASGTPVVAILDEY